MTASMPTPASTPTSTPGAPGTPSRTDRYIFAAVQSLPEKQRADVAAELRGSIQDAIDARIEMGAGLYEAEAAVLTELGDPERLAASYSGRQLYLIGPDVFPTYWRVLKQVLAIVVPLIVGIGIMVDLFDDQSLGSAIWRGAGGGFNVALHIVFWTTLVFGIVERTDAREVESMRTWSLDKLPDATPRQISRGDMLGGVATAAVAIALIALQTERSFVTNDAGDNVPVLNPDLWSFWLPALIGLFVIPAVFEVWKYRVGRWTPQLAFTNLAINAAFVAVTIWLAATDRLMNPELNTALDWGSDANGRETVGIIAAVSVALICAWDTVEGFYRAYRRSPEATSILTAPI